MSGFLKELTDDNFFSEDLVSLLQSRFPVSQVVQGGEKQKKIQYLPSPRLFISYFQLLFSWRQFAHFPPLCLESKPVNVS